MPLTVNTNLTNITTCETGTWVDIGSGPGSGFDTDTFLEGTGSRSRKISNSTKGFIFDTGSATDYTGRHVYLWILIQEIGILDTVANGGIGIVLAGATNPATNYHYWTVGGRDATPTVIEYKGGWKRYVIDTDKATTGTVGSPAALTSIQYVGAVCTTNATAGNLPTLLIDRMDYIDSTTAATQVEGATEAAPGNFQEIVDDETSATTKFYGIFREDSGAIFMNGGLEIGDKTGTASTYFVDNDVVFIPENPRYYDGTNYVSAVNETGFRVDVVGNATGVTQVQFGTRASGVITQPIITKSSAVPAAINFDEANTDGVNMQGSIFNGMGESDIDSLAHQATIVCVGDTAGSLAGTYFTFETIDGDGVRTKRYAYHNNGTDPAPAGRTGTAIATTNGDSAATVGAAIRTALGALADVTTSGSTNTAIITMDNEGVVEDITDVDTGHTSFTRNVLGSSYSSVTWENCKQIIPTLETHFEDCTVSNTNAGARATFTTDFATDDRLDITGHGLSTGDKVKLESSEGTEDLPEPLNDQTDYYVIFVSANEIELATTFANALAGTAISLTDNGTGTHTLHPSAAMRIPAGGTGTDLANVNFVGNTQYAIEISNTGTYDFDNVTFSNNGNDIFNSSKGAITINVANGDTPTIYNATGGSSTVNNTVTVRITCLDASDSSVIVGARVLLEAASGGDLSVGTDILSGTTNASGIIEDTAFNYTSDQPVDGRCRKGTTSTYYKTSPISGTITSSGLDLTIFMIQDE